MNTDSSLERSPLIGPSEARIVRALMGPRRWILAAVLLLGVAGGSFLRFHEIGKYGFWTDEFFHVFAAQSYNRDGKLTVPLHGEYTRALPITRITAWSFRHFGVSETSARAPFAAVNVLFLLVAFAVIRRIYGLFPALACFVVLAFSPFMIHMSRECRMYTVFQLLYFSWTMMFLVGFEPPRPRGGWEGRLDIDVRWLAASIVTMALSADIHDLTWNGGLVIAVYCGTLFVWEAVRRGPKAAILSKYGIAVAVIFAGLLLMATIGRATLHDLLDTARGVPDWAKVGRGATSYYRYLLSDAYPVLFFAYPLAAIAFAREHGRRGFFSVVSFSLLFILHSYVFGRKGDRYIFYIFPFFVLVSASLSAGALVALFDALRRALRDAEPWLRPITWIAGALFGYLFFYPWLLQGIHSPGNYPELDWKAAKSELEQESAKGEVIDTSPLPYIYYVGHPPAFYMLGEIWEEWPHGKHLIRNAADLKAALDRPGIQVIVTDQGRFDNDAFFNGEMEAVIDARTRLEKSKIDPRIRYYEEVPSRKP